MATTTYAWIADSAKSVGISISLGAEKAARVAQNVFQMVHRAAFQAFAYMQHASIQGMNCIQANPQLAISAAFGAIFVAGIAYVLNKEYTNS